MPLSFNPTIDNQILAFPPLLSDVIAADLGMKSYQVANSNIIALTAT